MDIEFLGDAPRVGISVFSGVSPNIWITYPPNAQGYSNPFYGVRAKPLGAIPPVFSAQVFEVTEQSLIGTEVGVLVANGDGGRLACLEVVGPEKVVSSLARRVLSLVDACLGCASGMLDRHRHVGCPVGVECVIHADFVRSGLGQLDGELGRQLAFLVS